MNWWAICAIVTWCTIFMFKVCSIEVNTRKLLKKMQEFEYKLFRERQGGGNE